VIVCGDKAEAEANMKMDWLEKMTVWQFCVHGTTQAPEQATSIHMADTDPAFWLPSQAIVDS
jgi:hypothetical protein